MAKTKTILATAGQAKFKLGPELPFLALSHLAAAQGANARSLAGAIIETDYATGDQYVVLAPGVAATVTAANIVFTRNTPISALLKYEDNPSTAEGKDDLRYKHLLFAVQELEERVAAVETP